MKIALIDGHRMFTEILKVNLLKSLPGLETISIYDTAEAFAVDQSEDSVTLIITELVFNGHYDKDVNRIFSTERKADVIILSSMTDEWRTRNYMNLGAKAFLTKNCSFQELLDAIAQVRKGNLFLSQDILDMLWAEITAGGPSMDNLSGVERAILEGLSRDEPFKAITSSLNISMIELKYHRRMLMERFGLKYFANLVTLAKKWRGLNTQISQNQAIEEREMKTTITNVRR